MGVILTQWEFFGGRLTLSCCYEGFKIMCRDWVLGTYGEDELERYS